MDVQPSAGGGSRARDCGAARRPGRVDRLFAIARRILHDVDRAEDALQDALVIAWRDLPDLRDPDRFDFWIQRLLANMCIDHARRDRRRYARLALEFDGPAGS